MPPVRSATQHTAGRPPDRPRRRRSSCSARARRGSSAPTAARRTPPTKSPRPPRPSAAHRYASCLLPLAQHQPILRRVFLRRQALSDPAMDPGRPAKFLTRIAGLGLAGIEFKPSWADLIRASTSLFRALEDVDAHETSPWAEGPRANPGQDEITGRFPSAGLSGEHLKRSQPRRAVRLYPWPIMRRPPPRARRLSRRRAD